MTESPVLFAIDGELVGEALRAAGEKFDSADGEVVLDFSSVRRLDPRALKAVEDFVDRADKKAVKVVLRGVNVGVYKVLKLARLASRFGFVA